MQAIKAYESWNGKGLPNGDWVKQKGARYNVRNPRLKKDKNVMSEYVPDYNQQCEVCGESPTVMVAEKDQITHDFNLCGVCTFGTAKALDVDWWNNPLDD